MPELRSAGSAAMSTSPTAAARRLAMQTHSRSAIGLTQAIPNPTTNDSRTSPKANQLGLARLKPKRRTKSAAAPNPPTIRRGHSFTHPQRVPRLRSLPGSGRGRESWEAAGVSDRSTPVGSDPSRG